MITMIVGGLAFLVLIAVVVGIIDVYQASNWRQVATERREHWESLHLQPQGPPTDDGDDD